MKTILTIFILSTAHKNIFEKEEKWNEFRISPKEIVSVQARVYPKKTQNF